MESLLDEVDSLITPGLSTETPEWCSNCQSLKQEIKRLQEEQLQSFGKLKQKIISTDLLIKKYKTKCDDYDVQCKRTEEANKRADKFQRQCEILETQLKAALLDTEPLRKTKMTLEAEIRLKNAEIQSMSDRMLAVESAQKQYEHMSKASAIDIEKLEAEKKDLVAKIKSMEAGKVTKEAAKEFKHEISTLKREKAAVMKNEKRLESKLAGALAKIEHLTNIAKERKFSPKRRRTASGNVSSPLKSPVRSQRGHSPRDQKQSPVGRGRSRTLSEKGSDFQNTDVTLPPSDEKLASGNTSSSDDSDDRESVCSVSWAFSPHVKCLSPLPPSPACFATRKIKRQDNNVDVDDEDDISDIAEVLEQQLLEEDTNQTILASNEGRNMGTENVNVSAEETYRKNNNEQTDEDSTKLEETPEETCNHSVNSQSEVKKAVHLDKNHEPLKDKEAGVFSAGDNKAGQLSLKEKLAESIVITSPTALRKQTAHQHAQNHSCDIARTTNSKNDSGSVERNANSKVKKSPVRRSTRINSQKDNETTDQACGLNESKADSVEIEKDSCNNKETTSDNASASGENQNDKPECDRLELCRNNTEEFTPTVFETLSDSDVEGKAKIITEKLPGVEEVGSNQSDVRLNIKNANSSVSSQDITDSIVTNVSDDFEKVDSDSVRTSSNEIKSDGTDKLIEIWKEKQTVEVRTVPTPKACIQKQEVGNKGGKVGTLHEDIEALKESALKETSKLKNQRKFGQGKLINFQKSSLGTLANEIEDFSYVGDYEVLDRSDKEPATGLAPQDRGMHKKNVKRRLRRTCKYRDRDSEISAEIKETISGVKTEQLDSPSKSLLDRSVNKVSSKETAEIKHSDISNERLENKKLELKSEKPLDVTESELNISETRPKQLPLEASQKSDGGQQEQVSKSVNSVERDAKSYIESDVKSNVGVNVKESLLEDKPGERILLESNSSDNLSEKVTPNRQMSTGFTVHVPTFERAPSTDGAVSFKNSHSRLFNLESGICDTIVEEETNETLEKVEIEHNNKTNSGSNLIFGVEDLLDDSKEEVPTVQNNFVNSQVITKPFCDINANTDDNYDTPKVDNVIRNTRSDTRSSSIVTLDDELNKPGCSYHLNESAQQVVSQEAADLTDASEGAFQDEKIPFISETLHQDDSSSRSSMQSFTSIERASPLSPLSISPFDFLNPISPLPPSPVREIERVSPLSPELVSDEQKSELDGIEPELDQNNEKDSHEGVKKEVSYDNIAKSAYIEEQASSVKNQSISKVERNFVENGHENTFKPEDNFGEKGTDFSICDKVKKIEEQINIKNSSGIHEKETNLDIESLNVFNLPQMISPVKTPKSHSGVKTEPVINSVNINELIQKVKDKTEVSNVLKVQEEKCLNKPKQFLTKAPANAVAVKPRSARVRTLLDKSNLEMCIRKSSRTALKRISSTEKADSDNVKKVSVDTKTAAVVKTQECELKSEKVAVKTIPDTENQATKVSDRSIENVEHLTGKNESVGESTVVNVDEKGDNKVIEESQLSHDNLAFKRKARVAHKPNIQPLKPKKIQIIDAPVLPQVRAGRKRKSLDNSKEAQDKKPCKEGVFQKQKSSASDGGVNPEARKKMQAYLKSSETAESFVSKFSTQDGKDELHLELLNVCLECLGRVQTDTLEPVYRTCENGQYLNIQYPFPFMSDVDKKAVELIRYLLTDQKADLTVVMRKIWNSIFSRDISTNVVGKMAQCRVFVALCSVQGDVEQARALFYHLLTCGHLNCTLFIVSVVSVWPEVLKKEPSDRPDKVISQGMTLVLEEIVTKMLLSQGSEASNKILLILKKLCHWSGVTGNADSIIKVLCGRLMVAYDEEKTDRSGVLELTKALELLCTSQTWQWFKEHFIMRHGLQTVSNKYQAVKIVKPVPSEYVCAILRITSHCTGILSSYVREKEYQQIIRNWLLPMLTHKPGDAKVRKCCIETLMELTPLYPSCLDSIHKWFIEEKDSVSQELAAKLEYLRQQYKQKFGLQCKPFLKT